MAKTVQISHGVGIVIGETSIIGEKVLIRQNVTIGQKNNLIHQKRKHPIIEDNVSIGAGAVILGPIIVGKNSVIGANAVVTKDVPPDSIVVGVPGRILNH